LNTDPHKIQCSENDEYHSDNDYFNSETGEMLYHIPAGVANLWPNLVNKALQTFAVFTKVRSEVFGPVELHSDDFQTVKTAWDEFDAYLADPATNNIKQKFLDQFAVTKAGEVPALKGKAMVKVAGYVESITNSVAEISTKYQQKKKEYKEQLNAKIKQGKRSAGVKTDVTTGDEPKPEPNIYYQTKYSMGMAYGNPKFCASKSIFAIKISHHAMGSFGLYSGEHTVKLANEGFQVDVMPSDFLSFRGSAYRPRDRIKPTTWSGMINVYIPFDSEAEKAQEKERKDRKAEINAIGTTAQTSYDLAKTGAEDAKTKHNKAQSAVDTAEQNVKRIEEAGCIPSFLQRILHEIEKTIDMVYTFFESLNVEDATEDVKNGAKKGGKKLAKKVVKSTKKLGKKVVTQKMIDRGFGVLLKDIDTVNSAASKVTKVLKVLDNVDKFGNEFTKSVLMKLGEVAGTAITGLGNLVHKQALVQMIKKLVNGVLIEVAGGSTWWKAIGQMQIAGLAAASLAAVLEALIIKAVVSVAQFLLIAFFDACYPSSDFAKRVALVQYDSGIESTALTDFSDKLQRLSPFYKEKTEEQKNKNEEKKKLEQRTNKIMAKKTKEMAENGEEPQVADVFSWNDEFPVDNEVDDKRAALYHECEKKAKVQLEIETRDKEELKNKQMAESTQSDLTHEMQTIKETAAAADKEHGNPKLEAGDISFGSDKVLDHVDLSRAEEKEMTTKVNVHYTEKALQEKNEEAAEKMKALDAATLEKNKQHNHENLRAATNFGTCALIQKPPSLTEALAEYFMKIPVLKHIQDLVTKFLKPLQKFFNTAKDVIQIARKTLFFKTFKDIAWDVAEIMRERFLKSNAWKSFLSGNNKKLLEKYEGFKNNALSYAKSSSLINGNIKAFQTFMETNPAASYLADLMDTAVAAQACPTQARQLKLAINFEYALGKPLSISVVASMFSRSLMKSTIPMTGLDIEATFETGRQFDVGKILNGHIKRSNDDKWKTTQSEFLKMGKAEKLFVNQQNSRCKECDRWIQSMDQVTEDPTSAIDPRDCKTIKYCELNEHAIKCEKRLEIEMKKTGHDETELLRIKKEQCKYVKYDLRIFMGRNSGYVLWFGGWFKDRPARTKELFQELKKKLINEIIPDADKKCPKDSSPSWCKNSLICRSIGVSCFSPEMNGLGI